MKEQKRGMIKQNKVYPSKGITVDLSSFYDEEDRRHTLFLKGALVYLVVMGAIGCFLSALDMEYSAPVLNVSVFIFSMFSVSLYYNKVWEKCGYLILLLLLIWTGSALGNYVNSGFYAIANAISERAAVFFDTSAMRSYGEQVGNRYAAVTVSMCFIGCVCCVIANILISRRMRYRMAAFISVGLLLIPIYLEREPDIIYAVMLITGIISVYIIKEGGHYKLTSDNKVYEFEHKERKISYVYSAKTMAQVMAVVLTINVIIIGLSYIFYPEEEYSYGGRMSGLKESTLDTVENISILGIMGLFNFYPSNGGLTNGTLGGVSSVRLDLETDLTVEFAPYSDERIYLKTFEGGTYNPYGNSWSRLTDANGRIMIEKDEDAARLKENYEDGAAYSAKGVIKIKNVAAAAGVYLPYYSEDTDKIIYPGRIEEYVFYPRLYGGVAAQESPEADDIETEQKSPEATERWLDVPEQNREVIAEFVKEAGLKPGDPDEAVRGLASYYQENIPYTLRPGMTPYRKDFVNYFLSENKRGYCAHFASAATLIFRYLGIPARYVEGYAIDPADIAGRGEIIEDAVYEDYYDGYSPLMTNAVVSVDATDANAHAWVEIYDEKEGWIVADVTPVSYEEEPGESLWQRLMDFLGGGTDDDAEAGSDNEDDAATGLDERTRQLYARILAGLAVIFTIAFTGRIIIKKAIALNNYRKLDLNGRLIVRYRNYIEKIAGRQKELTNMVNYEEQISWLISNGYWKIDQSKAKEYRAILEKAGFSNETVSEEEFKKLLRLLTVRI